MQFKFINGPHPLTIKQMTALHFQLLQESFLNYFGQNLVEKVYEVFLNSQNNLVLIAYENPQKIAGFLVAIKDINLFKNTVFADNFWLFFRQTLATLTKNPLFILYILRWAVTKNRANITTHLQFIAVGPRWQRKGIGTKMMKLLQDKLAKDKVKHFLVATKKQNLQSNQFYRKLKFRLLYTEKIFDSEMNFYLSPKITSRQGR